MERKWSLEMIKSAVFRVRPWGPSARKALSRRLMNLRFPSSPFPAEAPLSFILERGLQARRCEQLTPLWTRVKGETTKVNRYLCSFWLEGGLLWSGSPYVLFHGQTNQNHKAPQERPQARSVNRKLALWQRQELPERTRCSGLEARGLNSTKKAP